eukprot:2083959-Pleurochrysis_carterae.AAC.2
MGEHAGVGVAEGREPFGGCTRAKWHRHLAVRVHVSGREQSIGHGQADVRAQFYGRTWAKGHNDASSGIITYFL